MIYSFSYQMDEQDYYEFNRRHMFHAPGARKNLLIARLGVPFALLIIGGMMARSREQSVPFFAAFALVALGYVVFFNRLMERRLKKNIKKLGRQGSLYFGKPMRLEFFDEQITETTGESSASYAYSRIERIDDSGDAIYLFFGAMQAFVLPGRVFESPQQRQEFLAFVAPKIGQAVEA